MTRLRTRLAASILVTVIAFGAAGPAAVGQVAPTPAPGGGNDPFGFAVRPFTAPGALPRDAIDYELQPGQTVRERVSVINVTDVAKEFYVYAQAAYNAPVGGGFALNLRTDRVTDAAAWITVPVTLQTVPAHTAAIIPVTIAVPADAEPGDHAAGVVAEEVVAPATLRSGQGVVKIPRVATRVYLRVKGPLHPLLQVQRLAVVHHDPVIPFVTGSGSTSVAYTVKNVGNVRVQLDEVSVTVTDLLGRQIKRLAVVRGPSTSNALPDQLLPNNAASFTVRWNGLPPLDELTAQVKVVGEEEVVRTPVSAGRSRSFWVVPWYVLAVVVVVALGVVFWRRRRGRAAAGDATGRAPTDDLPGGSPAEPHHTGVALSR